VLNVQDDAPRYIRAISIIGCLYVAELTIMVAWRTYYTLENRKRNKAQAEAGITEAERVRLGAINAEIGMTDRSKPSSSSSRLTGIEN
jgi:ACS family allantoate permease-like MFS transporter